MKPNGNGGRPQSEPNVSGAISAGLSVSLCMKRHEDTYRQTSHQRSQSIVEMGTWLLSEPLVVVGGMSLLSVVCGLVGMVVKGDAAVRGWDDWLTVAFCIILALGFSAGTLFVGVAALLRRTAERRERTGQALTGGEGTNSRTSRGSCIVACQECGTSMCFPRARKGTIGECPRCRAYVDVE